MSREKWFLFICAIGCASQLISVTYNFLKFKVRMEITYDHPKSIAIPEIDISIPLVDLINMSGLYSRHPKEMVDICNNFFRDTKKVINNMSDFNHHCSWIKKSWVSTAYLLPKILTIGDIEQLTIDPRKMIKEIVFDDFKVDLLKTNICTISRYFSGVFVFLRISCRNNSKIIYKSVERNNLENNWLIIINLNITGQFGFRFAAPNSLLESRAGQYFHIYPIIDHNLSINTRFKRFISQSLPWPFETLCKSYDPSLALVKCINEKLLFNFPPSVFIDSIVAFGQHSSNLKFADKVYTDYDHDKYLRIANSCSKVKDFQPCNSIVYHTSATIYKEIFLGTNQPMVQICLEPPIDPDTCYKAHPAITITEYLVYISSTLGIWFGISIYGHMNKHFQSFIDFLRKRKVQNKPARKNKPIAISIPTKVHPVHAVNTNIINQLESIKILH